MDPISHNPTPQSPPGSEADMKPKPESDKSHIAGSGKLQGKVALVSGGDSGIGRAAALALAKEGATIAIAYLNEQADAQETQRLILAKGQRAILFPGDLGFEEVCQNVVRQVVDAFGQIDILINNCAEQHEQHNLTDITATQLERTFRTNIYSYFFLTKAVLPHMPEGGAIINTASVTAYRGSAHLLDYSATKGAKVAFTRSLSQNLAPKKIRVNAVAPGPVWTPLIVSSFNKEKIQNFGKDVPLGRPGQPEEIGPCYVFLASDESSYMTGQVLHPNGGEIING